MNKKILQVIAPEQLKDIEAGRCPICGKLIDKQEFRDALSLKEFTISGLCQKCQDGIFGK